MDRPKILASRLEQFPGDAKLASEFEVLERHLSDQNGGDNSCVDRLVKTIPAVPERASQASPLFDKFSIRPDCVHKHQLYQL
jgi:hypothetical protein